ncbi:Sucrose transport protein SUT1 [Platanthera guangdongensis]|uniref:Sucrose transport protein SUT1 n=1 Tax=Platanthera guangdongensis TaxID=2320717 RepID=A0ABR2N604_9ASPA
MGSEKEVRLRGQHEISLVRLIICSMVSGGVQYGWALQLTLLTPYVETLGLPHALASIAWLCGPVTGLDQRLVCGAIDLGQDLVEEGHLFLQLLVIGFSSDIGVALGDTQESCSTYVGPRWKAAVIYVVGFWALDFANNTVQGPTRAMMADLSGKHGCSAANIIYAFWMAIGNILGFSSGAGVTWYKFHDYSHSLLSPPSVLPNYPNCLIYLGGKIVISAKIPIRLLKIKEHDSWLPSLMTNSCCEDCANLKGAFLVAVMFLVICLTVSLIAAKEVMLSDLDYEELESSGIFSVFQAFKRLPAGMPSVLSVTALTWLAWFPFLLYNTDWMGREIFHGDPSGTKQEIESYNMGVQQGAFGLLLTSIVLGITTMLLEHLCRKVTPRLVWVMGNFTLFLAMLAITVLSFISKNRHNSVGTAEEGVKNFALAIEAFLGFPIAVSITHWAFYSFSSSIRILLSIPFTFAAQLATNEGGTHQGLAIGVLNISIVVPQVFVAFSAGPWDALFGDGNIPAFALAGILAIIAAFFGFTKLPTLTTKTSKIHSFGSMH